jgi:serine phosphatase RsbU (regulator of sigma subunit)/ligand-binding sensor domain-containing protein
MYKTEISISKFLNLLLVFALFSITAKAQVKNLGLPYIINFSVEEYHASKQNWAIVEDSRGIMYFGNNLGVLEFDGQNWKLIPLPNNSIVRSLTIDEKGRIYVGSRGEFGFLQPDSIGSLKYISLIEKIEKKEDRKFAEDIGRTFIYKDKVYFCCDDRIFEFYNNNIKLIRIPNLKQVYESNGHIFVRIEGENGGMGELVDGKVKMLSSGVIFKDLTIKALLPYDKKILIATMEKGLYLYDFKTFDKLKTNIDKFLEEEKIVSASMMSDGNYAIGLFSSGLLIIDKLGNVIQHLNLTTGLQNGSILSVIQDSNGNLWLATGNGITYILSSLPVTAYSNLYGLNSAIYSAFFLNDHLYAASAEGLFYRKWGNNEAHLNQVETFDELGEPMNIWSLDTLNNNLLAATNKGISQVVKDKISDFKLPERSAIWKFLRVNGNPYLMLAGTNKGLLVLEYKQDKLALLKEKIKAKINSKNTSKSKMDKDVSKGKWVYKSKVRGFTERCRHVEIDKNNYVWFSDKAKGIARLKPINNFDSVSVYWYNQDKGLPKDEEMYVFLLKDQIFVSSEKGIFAYNSQKDVFENDVKWNPLIGKGILITQIVEDDKGNIWFKQQRKNRLTNDYIFELGQLVLQDDGTYVLNKTPFYKFKNSIYSISPLSDGNIIIGTDKGFIHYDTKVEKDYKKTYSALIRKVELVTNDSLIFDGTFSDSSGYMSARQKAINICRFPYKFNNIRFTFSAPYFDAPDQIMFKYYLEDNDLGWSDWKNKNFKEYSNLPAGTYVFHVKAKNIYEVESEEAVYYFTILPPWYLTIWAIIGYGIAVILLIYGIVRLSVRRLRLQKEHLEKVVEERTAEIRMKNVELEQQKEEISAQRDEIEVQRDKIEEKNKNITASITYAKRIQEAMLPLRDKIDQAFDDYFILFKPRDIVSGDFYWFSTRNDKIIFTAVDCTGHGVPGAFMSMIGSEILTTIVNQGITMPSEILDYMNRYVRKALKQDQTENQDGMDMSLCTINKQEKNVEWSGAKNPLIYIQNNEIFHLKGDMQSIGGHQLSKKERQFTNNIVSYSNVPTYFYIFTDGFQDQFGGDKGRKFMVKNLKDLIFENHNKPMKEQQVILEAAVEDWKSGADQTDDILVIGFKLTP